MRMSSLGLLVIALIFGGAAMFGARAYIAGQSAPVAVVEEVPTETVVVAARELTFGAPLDADALKVITWPADRLPEGVFTKVDDLLGEEPRYARMHMAVGEPIVAARVTEPGEQPTLSSVVQPKKRAVTIRVNEVLGVAGLISPGDHVDVMLTRTDPDSGLPTVDVLLQDVPVLALNQEAGGGREGESKSSRQRAGEVRTVTLEVDVDVAQRLVLAGEVGRLSLVLRGRGQDGDVVSRQITMGDLLAGRSPAAADPPAATEAPQTAAAASPQEPAEPRSITIYRGMERTEHSLTL